MSEANELHEKITSLIAATNVIRELQRDLKAATEALKDCQKRLQAIQIDAEYARTQLKLGAAFRAVDALERVVEAAKG